MEKLRIYIASSWKQKEKVNRLAAYLRDQTAFIEEVYDFTDPNCGAAPFTWHSISNKVAPYTLEEYERLRFDPIAVKAFQRDMSAMQRADVCILLLPCGASAHSEAGWFAGKGKPVIVMLPTEIDNLELMYKMYDRIIGDININLLFAKLTTYLEIIAKRKEAHKNEPEPSELCPVKTDDILESIAPDTQILVKSTKGRIGYVPISDVFALQKWLEKNIDNKDKKSSMLESLIRFRYI